MCQVHTGAYVSLLAAGKTDFTACRPRKTTTYILHVVPYHYANARQTQVTWKKKQRKEKKGKERKDKKAKNEKRKEIKENTRKARKDKTRTGSKERKREKMSYSQTLRTA